MSAAQVVVRRAARQDIARHYGWLESEAGIETAERFMAAADRSFATLASNPAMGSKVSSRQAPLGQLRKWRVDGFPRSLIFYLPRRDGIHVVRVLHAAQDWYSLLDVD